MIYRRDDELQCNGTEDTIIYRQKSEKNNKKNEQKKINKRDLNQNKMIVISCLFARFLKNEMFCLLSNHRMRGAVLVVAVCLCECRC